MAFVAVVGAADVLIFVVWAVLPAGLFLAVLPAFGAIDCDELEPSAGDEKCYNP